MDNKQFNELSKEDKERLIGPELMSVLGDADFEKLYDGQRDLKNIPKEWVKEACTSCIEECKETINIIHSAIADNSFEVECGTHKECEQFEDLFLEKIINNVKQVIIKNEEDYKNYKMILTFPTIIEENYNLVSITF